MRRAWVSIFNDLFPKLSAKDRVALVLEQTEYVILSSSFGAQSAACLHLAASVKPNIPVVLIDTGYLFPETYDFVDDLKSRLKLNLHIYRNPVPPYKQEQHFGKLWTQGLQGLKRYNDMNKVEPMKRALKELNCQIWLTGLRHQHSPERARLSYALEQWGYVKAFPILDWTDHDIYLYLKEHDLPYHPLWHKGYISIGDTHSTKSVHEVDDETQLRFFGLKRECGLHEI